MIKILVIIVTYNAKPWIDKCFSSVLGSSYQADLFVIDNGSTDGTQDYIKKNYPNIFFQQSKSNLGFGGANNIGLKFALKNNYDYVYLLNQDAWIFPDTLEKLVNAHKRHPEYGIISPMQCQANMHSLDKNFVNNVCYRIIHGTLLNDLYFNTTNDIYEVPAVMAAHWLISRECLVKVGGFSPTFYHYGEDDNYCDRVIYFHYKIGILINAVAVHDRENRKKVAKHTLYMFYVSILRCASNPLRQPKINISLVAKALKLSIKLKTLKPFAYYIKYICNIKTVWQNKKISIINETAFL